MSRMFITQNRGPSKLKLGHPVMSDKYDAIAFTLDPTTPEPIMLGEAMMTGEIQGTYIAVKHADEVVTADNVNRVIGFTLGANVMVPRVFPADGPTMVHPGAGAACVVGGAVAVRFAGGENPLEQDKVYIVTASTSADYEIGMVTDGAVVENVTKVQLPQWRFMGITDTDEGYTVTAIHKGF